MISECPACKKPLNLTDPQIVKVKEALARLTPDKFIKLGCPHCRAQMKLGRDGMLFKEPAFSPVGQAGPGTKLPVPPKPPDVSWLASGVFTEREVIEDVPMAMILIEDAPFKSTVIETFEAMGYQTAVAESGEDAVERMRFVNFSAVVLSAGFEKGGIAGSAFHAHMKSLSMTKRRYMYYVLIGQEFHTFYDLEALAYSANLVVNTNDACHMNIILRKGLNDYEDLFGPFLATLKEHGKI